MRRRKFLAGAAALSFGSAKAEILSPGAQALSGDRFTIGEQEFILADIMAPPLYTLSKYPPAYFEQSRSALQHLFPDAAEINDALPPTRWNARVVTVGIRESAQTLQERLVQSGAVRVAPQSGDHEFVKRLYALENVARQNGVGLWSYAAYRVFDALNAAKSIGDYNLIEGRVVRAEKYGSRFYLNFGDDFKTDFTATATSTLYRRWVKAGFDLATLKDATLRVRGYVEPINGPSIDMKHPLQVELLNVEAVT